MICPWDIPWYSSVCLTQYKPIDLEFGSFLIGQALGIRHLYPARGSNPNCTIFSRGTSRRAFSKWASPMDTWSWWSLFVYWKWWILVSWSFDIFFVAWFCLYCLRSSAYIDFEVDDCIICLFQWTKNQVCWRRRGTRCKFLLRVWVHQAGCLHLTVLLIYLERKLEDAQKYHETKWVMGSYIFFIFTQITWAKMIQFDLRIFFSDGVGETTNYRKW